MDNGGYDRNQMWYAFRITTQNNKKKNFKVEIQPRKKIDKFQLGLLGGISKILFVITRNYSNQPN